MGILKMNFVFDTRIGITNCYDRQDSNGRNNLKKEKIYDNVKQIIWNNYEIILNIKLYNIDRTKEIVNNAKTHGEGICELNKEIKEIITYWANTRYN